MRIGTDIVGGTTPLTFNAASSLIGEVPKPGSLSPFGAALLGIAPPGRFQGLERQLELGKCRGQLLRGTAKLDPPIPCQLEFQLRNGGFAAVERATNDLVSTVDGAEIIIVVTGGNSRERMK